MTLRQRNRSNLGTRSSSVRLFTVLAVGSLAGCADGHDEAAGNQRSSLDRVAANASPQSRDDPASKDGGLRSPTSGTGACSELAVCQDGERKVVLPDVCFSTSDVEEPRGKGLFATCFVDPEGHVFVAFLGEGSVIANEGWTHSAYGRVRSTLAESSQVACSAAIRRFLDSGTGDRCQ